MLNQETIFLREVKKFISAQKVAINSLEKEPMLEKKYPVLSQCILSAVIPGNESSAQPRHVDSLFSDLAALYANLENTTHHSLIIALYANVIRDLVPESKRLANFSNNQAIVDWFENRHLPRGE